MTAIVSAIVMLFEFSKLQAGKVKVVICVILMLIILVLYLYTPNIYYRESDKHQSFLLVLLGQILPVVICASITAHVDTAKDNIKILSPIVSILFTVLAFFAAFFPSSATTGGFTSTEYGLNYQSTSYLAAYAAGFSLYYLMCFEEVAWTKLFQKRIVRLFMMLSIVVNFLTILIAGGRGGLVLFVAHIGFAAYIHSKKSELTFKRVVNLIGLAIIALTIILLCVHFAENLPIKTNGFERILTTVERGDQNGRDILRTKALHSFLESPVIGHGLGSVFYEIGGYSHNCITDALVEIGVIGCFLFLALLCHTWRKCMYLFQEDMTNYIWIVIFFDGFVMSLFSGYYIAQLPILWVVTYMFCSMRTKIS